MAKENVNSSATKDFRMEYQFEPFVFSREVVNNVSLPGAAVMRFVNTTHDIANGAQSVMDLLEWDALREESVKESDTPAEQQQPILSPFHRANLHRFVTASLQMLVAECDNTHKWAYEVHTAAGRKEAFDQAISSNSQAR